MSSCKIKNVIREIELNEELVYKIQKLHYELDGFKNIFKAIAGQGNFKYDYSTYRWILHDYQMANAEFNLFMEELRIMYANDLPHDIESEISFEKCTVMFYNGGSSCGL